jgi:DNA-directed RNA polymerase II subunit RPB2
MTTTNTHTTLLSSFFVCVSGQAFGMHLISLSHKPQHNHRMCSVETPEGHSCGAVKHMALFAAITLGLTNTAALHRALVEEAGVDESIVAVPGHCRNIRDALVVVNGIMIGSTADPAGLLAQVANWRETRRFPPELGFVHVRGALLNEVRLLTDAGRVMTYYITLNKHTGLPLITPKMIQSLQSGTLTFADLVAHNYITPLCAQTGATANVAYQVSDLLKERYDYCAIHPAGIFGLAAAVNIPRAHHNHVLRSMFQVSPFYFSLFCMTPSVRTSLFW